MSRIYIFENTSSLHAEEALITTYNILNRLDYEVSLCLGPRTAQRVANNEFLMAKDVILVPSLGKLFKFISNVKKHDIVVYPTIAARNVVLLFIMNLFIAKNIYYIRSSNSWLKYSNHQGGFGVKTIRLITHYIKKYLLKNAFQIFVANANIKAHLAQYTDKCINIIPYKLAEDNLSSPKFQTPLTYLIPGAVDTNKKDLNQIRQATALLTPQELENVKIVLLGRPSNPVDVKFCNQWKSEIGDSLTIYDKFIPTEEFDGQLKNAHYIIGILTIDYQDKYNQEIYGVTKDTGVDAQAIAYGKPLIINKPFAILPEIASSSQLFGNPAELADIFKASMASPAHYDGLSQAAIDNSQKFTLDIIVSKLENI